MKFNLFYMNIFDNKYLLFHCELFLLKLLNRICYLMVKVSFRILSVSNKLHTDTAYLNITIVLSYIFIHSYCEYVIYYNSFIT